MLSFLDRMEINEGVGWGGGKYETAQKENFTHVWCNS